jgi:hypothetical protein
MASAHALAVLGGTPVNRPNAAFANIDNDGRYVGGVGGSAPPPDPDDEPAAAPTKSLM